ncbi:MAG: His-Xaa-Ser system radical SAM maturase HxsB [Elusimicrobiota bacterium]
MKSKKHGKKNTETNQKSKSDIIHIRWKKIKDKILVTNDFGYYVMLKESEFKKFVDGKIKKGEAIYNELASKGFISDNLDFEDIFSRWKNSNSYLFFGPALHIIVATLRCNHKCVYCQSQAIGEKDTKTDMNYTTAKKAVDMAFSSTSPTITIEFQGGEPLYNWEIVKKTIKYSRDIEKKKDKRLNLSVVTNFSLMDEEKAEFLLENEVSLCTSLDGPKELHNKNRIYTAASSYDIAVKWIKYFNQKHDTQHNLAYRIFKPSALTTVSRESLKYPQEILDEYVKNGLETIFIRPLSPIGFARKLWDKIGYDSESFLKFYKTALLYIIELNAKGVEIKEKTAQMIVHKIINSKDSGFVDLRCPCGAGLGQLAYNYNGDIYTCDEGRMLGWEGNDFFKLGNLNKNSYKQIISSPTTKVCAISSNLENQIQCSRCVYKPYCGVCPVINYEAQNNIWGNNATSERCKIFMGIMDIIFEFLNDNKKAKFLERWAREKEEMNI